MAAAADGGEEEDGGRLMTIGEEDDKQMGTQHTNKHQVFRDDEEEDEYI